MKEKEYKFVPAYYEWHLVDEEGTVLLNMNDPAEEMALCKTYDDVKTEVEDFIVATKQEFDCWPDEKTIDGNTPEMFDKLPSNAVEIMAQALYDYYVA